MVAEIASGLAVLYLVKTLIDTVSGLPPVNKATVLDVTPLLRVVLLTAACTLVFLATRAVSAVAREAQGLQLADYVNGKIQEQSMRLDLAFFESSRYFDTLQRARAAGSQRPSQVAANILMLGKNCLMLAGVAALLGTISWLVLMLLALVLVPALVIRLHFTRSLYDWRHRRTQMDRQSRYLDWLMTSDVYAKEVRLGGLENLLRSRYIQLREVIRGEQMGISRRRAVFETLGAALGTIVFAGTLAHLAFEATQGRSSVGDLALFFVVFQRAQAMSLSPNRRVLEFAALQRAMTA